MKFLDERFLDRRRRSTAMGGIAGVIVAVGLFEYRYFVNHIWSWDLLAVAVAMVTVKMSLMAWYHIHDSGKETQ
jgi:hypothetical protein